jgi:translocator protein
MKKPINWKVLIVSFIIVFGLLGGIGSYFNAGNTNSSWYSEIKPSITPPGWVFPIAWNILFILIIFSLYLAWTNSKTKKDKTRISLAFGINFIVNMLWSLFFFGMRNPLLGFIDIVVVWLTIILMIFVAGKINKKAGWLLVPYLLWVSFASILNGLIAFG